MASFLNISTIKISSMICLLKGHQYQKSNEITEVIKEYQCVCCGNEITIDAQGRYSTLTQQLKEINRTLREFHQRRKKAWEQHQLAIKHAS